MWEEAIQYLDNLQFKDITYFEKHHYILKIIYMYLQFSNNLHSITCTFFVKFRFKNTTK